MKEETTKFGLVLVLTKNIKEKISVEVPTGSSGLNLHTPICKHHQKSTEHNAEVLVKEWY